MNINMHTNFYNNFNTTFEGRKPYKNRKSAKAENKPAEIQVMQFKRDPNTPNPLYESGLQDGYEMGYEQGKKDNKTIGKIGMFVLGALSALNLYSTKLSIDNCNTNNAILSYEIAESNYDLNQKLNELQFDINFNDTILLETILDLTLEMESLQEQQKQLKEQIEALPEDSEEAQILKEELRLIEEQYEILEEKYNEYILEQQNKDIENPKNDYQENTPNDAPFKNQTIFMV